MATGNPAPTLSVSGTLPGGVSFNAATGVLSGTPANGGIYPFTFTAGNGIGRNATQPFTLTVAHSVTVTWTESDSTVVGYNVIRGTTMGGHTLRL